MRCKQCVGIALALALGTSAPSFGQEKGFLPMPAAGSSPPARVVSAETLYVVMPDGRKIPAGTAIPAQYTEQPTPAAGGDPEGAAGAGGGLPHRAARG